MLLNLVRTRAAPLQGAAADSPRWYLASALLRALGMRPRSPQWTDVLHEVVAALATVPTWTTRWPAVATLATALTTSNATTPMLGGQVNALTTPLWQQRMYTSLVSVLLRHGDGSPQALQPLVLGMLCHATAVVPRDVAMQEAPTTLPMLVAGLPVLLQDPCAEDCHAVVAVLEFFKTVLQQPTGTSALAAATSGVAHGSAVHSL